MRTPDWAHTLDCPEDIALRSKYCEDYDQDTWQDKWKMYTEDYALDAMEDVMQGIGPAVREERTLNRTEYGEAIVNMITTMIDGCTTDGDIYDSLDTIVMFVNQFKDNAESMFFGVEA